MKKKIISAALAAVLACGVFISPVQEYIGGISSVAAAESAVSAPKASRKSGTYSTSGAFSVKLTAAKGAKIYYSTGGSWRQYTKALKISKNTTLKCYAEKDGSRSKTVSYTYKLVPKVTISAKAGTYDDPVKVTLSSSASGVKFYYTLDGSKPTTSSALYTTKGITVSRSAALRIVAVKSGWAKKYFRRDYVIEGTESALPGESLLDDYTKKYAYNTLTNTQKRVYEVIFEAAKNHGGAIDISGLGASSGDVEKAYWAFDYENPQFFWLGNGYSYVLSGGKPISIEIQYFRSKSEGERLTPLFEAEAQKIIDKAMEQDDLFDRVKVIHDEIVNMTDYSVRGASYKSEADGPIMHGLALCEGYSKAFAYLCQAVGIECFCVAGYAGEGHMWNMLKLDGEWYNMDVTWDDPENGSTSYQYFCIPTSKIKSDHSFNNPFTVPSATATKYSYSEVMGIKEYSSLTSAYNGILTEAAANYRNGVMETTIYINGTFMDSLAAKVNSQGFYRDLTGLGCSFTNWSISYTRGAITLTIK